MGNIIGLDDVVERPPTQSLEGRIQRGVRRDDDHFDVRELRFYGAKHLDPGHVGHSQVESDNVYRFFPEHVQCFFPAVGDQHAIMGMEDHS
ncbi:hypothetical protein HRbin30_01035 [bacterium HR30]|nr:hypothetical protein HRbin30_01035 [bacterium HR30]